MGWNADEDERLAALWTEGLTSVAIGRAMKRSKSSVLGRVHRLELTPRASPLPPGKAGRTAGATLAGAGAVAKARAKAPAAILAPPVPIVQWLPVQPIGPPRECQWPIGHPKTPAFRFCCDDAHPFRAYCPMHCRVAFIGWHP